MNAVRTCVLLALLMLPVVANVHAQATTPAHTSTTQRPGQAEPAQKRAVDRIKDYTVVRRQEAVDAARKSTEALDRDIARLQEDVQDRWSGLSSDARANTRSAMAEVRARRTRVAEWYGGMQHGSDAAWDEVKAGFVDSYHTLADAFRRARTQFEAARSMQPSTPQPKEGKR